MFQAKALLESPSEGLWNVESFCIVWVVSRTFAGFWCRHYSLEPGRFTSRKMWVIPALYPMKAVKWGESVLLSFGKDLTFPRCLLHLLRGKKPFEPWRGAENFLCDYKVEFKQNQPKVSLNCYLTCTKLKQNNPQLVDYHSILKINRDFEFLLHKFNHIYFFTRST